MIYRLILLIALFATLFAQDPDLTPFENDPLTIAAGKVHVITGEPVLYQDDLIIQGVEPIRISRALISGINSHWHQGLLTYMDKPSGDKIIITEKNGAPVTYKKGGKVFYEGVLWRKYNPCNLLLGYANTSQGKISSRTNLKNQYLLFSKSQSYFLIFTPDGTRRFYDLKNKPLLKSEHLPNGNWIFYKYKEGKLSSIHTMNPTRNKIYAYAAFTYKERKGYLSCRVKGSDRSSLGYRYYNADDFSQTGTLSKIISSDLPDQDISYLDLKQQFTKKNNFFGFKDEHRIKELHSPLNPSILFDYYNSDDTVSGQRIEMEDTTINLGPGGAEFHYDGRRGRVKHIRNLSGLNITHSFIYNLKNRRTSVYEADSSRTDYIWDPFSRLVAMERYSTKNERIHLQIFEWDPEGKLLRKQFRDENGEYLHSKTYSYNARGDVEQECFNGNLSGEGAYNRRFTYSENGLLTEEKNDLGARKTYTYLPGTDLMTSCFTFNGSQIETREFWEYDKDNLLHREIVDNGTSLNAEDFTGVTVRTIRQITRFDSSPYIGMPSSIEEKYWEEAQEKLLSKTVLTYTFRARIEKKEIFDANGKFQYALKMKYDEKGRLTSETNPLGQERIIRYDAGGKEIFSQDFSARKTTTTHYHSYFHLPEKIEVKGNDGTVQTSTIKYDYRRFPIEVTDTYKNKTIHNYDCLGQRIFTQLPSIVTDSGDLQSGNSTTKYDANGNPTHQTDAHGHTTQTTYNALGKPILIIHPDGAKEKYSYYCNGLLKTYTDPSNLVTEYEYDALQRVTVKTIGGVRQETFKYRGAQLVLKTDAEKNQTIYAYDGAGRKIKEETNGEEIIYSYDALGREKTVQRQDMITVREFDLMDRIIEEREESEHKILRKKEYEYDAAGNQKTWITYVNDQKTIHAKKYDALSRLIEEVDPSGASETTLYDNLRHQKTHTDPMGLQTVEIFDARGKVSDTNILKKGELLFSSKKYYTQTGNLTFQIDTAYAPTRVPRETRARWEYNERGRLTKLTEAVGTSDAKITHHTYTPRGEIKETTKPDGTKLFYEYDPFGALKSLTSSDKTVSHQMRYNKLGMLIWHDGIARTPDHAGRLLSEEFSSGLSIHTSYDQAGRKLQSKVPSANCVVDFVYKGDLKDINRKNLNGQTLYSHHYLERDLSGNIFSSALSSGGSINHGYDLCGRRKSIQSSAFNQEVLEQDLVGNIIRLKTQKNESSFSYDSMYQLSSEEGLFTHNYAHDSLYCRLEKDQESYQVNALNQITSHLRYDKNGNVSEKGEDRYCFDALDRLIRIETQDAIETFTYDFLNRKLSSKTLTENGEQVRHFLYDGQNEIGSFDESLRPLELRILAETPHAEIGAAIGVELNGKAYAPIHDVSGNLAALIPIDGSPATVYRYSAFGEEQIEGDVISSWRFSSKRAERSGLTYYGRRFYTPEYGRWLSPDPSGFTDGTNLYAFVHNDPLTHFDEYGLYGLEDFGTDAWNVWTSPRVQGPIQMGLGAWEMANSLPLLATAPPVGAFVLSHGADQFQAGLQTFLKGEHVPSLTSQGLQKIGIPEMPANLLDGMLSSKGAGLASLSRGSRFSSNTFSSGVGFLTKVFGNPLERQLLGLPVKSRQFQLNDILKNTSRPANPKFLSLTKTNYRENLVRSTGINPGKAAQAHHIFPQKHRDEFMKYFGINIDNPKYLTWVDSDVHRQMHNGGRYNAQWDMFFRERRTNYLEIAEQLAQKNNFIIRF